MKAHLIKSEEVSSELFERVMKLLQAVPGEIKFTYDKESAQITHPKNAIGTEIEKLSTWKELFTKSSVYRDKNKIAPDEFCLLLTDTRNERNYFAALEDTMPFNGFVHTGDWDLIIDCPPEFPIAHVVLTIMLLKYLNREKDYHDFEFHRQARGCISDFCEKKTDILYKLRMADICKSCMNGLMNKLSLPVVTHAWKIMESLRPKMLDIQNFQQATKPSRLKITRNFEIILEDFDKKKIVLSPLEKALYFLFLKYPDGIYLSCLPDYRKELYEIYGALSNRGDLIVMHNRINEMTRLTNNNASEKLSKIRKAFRDAIGDELAQHYIIDGENAQLRKISIDRSLVIMERL